MRLARLLSPALLLTLAPSTAGAVASAELYHTQAYVYGRFEARIRYAPSDGVISSFFLWKEGSEAANAYWNELDFEKLEGSCRMQTNAIFGNPESGHEQSHTTLGDLCGAYHDYSFEWTPTYISWVVDGKEIRRETGAIATAFSQNASAGMTFHFNVWPGNSTFGGNFNPSTLPTRQYISWVRYSSFKNDSFQREWQQDFDAASLPSGWAIGTWASPLNLSTHNAANVSFVSGIAVLSLTADNSTGFSGTPPKDDATGAGGAMSGGAGGRAGGEGGVSARGGNGGTASGGLGAGGKTAGSGGSAQSSGGSSQSSGGSAQSSGGSAQSSGGSAQNSGGSPQNSGGSSQSSGGSAQSSGGMTAMGGRASVGTGGTPSSGGASTGGAGAASPPKSDPGCSCSVPVGARGAAGFGSLALAAAAVFAARRARRRS